MEQVINKQDLSRARTSEDVLRRTGKEVIKTQEEIKEINTDVSSKVSADSVIRAINNSPEAISINPQKINLYSYATKNYVDDSIESAITDALTGNY